MTSAAELRDQMLNRRTSSATEAQAMRERNVDADMLDRERMTKGEAAPAATDVDEESPDDETDLAELTARRNWKKNLPDEHDVPKTESVDVQKQMIKDIVDAQIVDELHTSRSRRCSRCSRCRGGRSCTGSPVRRRCAGGARVRIDFVWVEE